MLFYDDEFDPDERADGEPWSDQPDDTESDWYEPDEYSQDD